MNTNTFEMYYFLTKVFEYEYEYTEKCIRVLMNTPGLLKIPTLRVGKQSHILFQKYLTSLKFFETFSAFAVLLLDL